MRIEIVVYSLKGGGAERVAANLANAWVERGHDVGITLLSAPTPGDYATAPAVEIFSAGPGGSSGNLFNALIANTRKLIALRRRIASVRPDVTFAVMADSCVLVALTCVGLPTITVGCEHNNPPLSINGPVWKLLRRLLYRLLDCVVVLTSGADDWILKNVPSRQVAVIPNAVSWPVPATGVPTDPDSLIAPDRKLFLASGRMVPAKGFDMMLDTFSTVSEALPDWDLAIMGDGPDRPALEAQRERLGLAGRVHMVGRIGNVADWYRRASVFVMSSRFEGLPMVMLEAMAGGLPAVSFDFNYGPRDIIRPDVDGVITPAGDTQALAGAMIALAQDDARRAALAARAVEVRERFSEESVLRKWDALFGALRARNGATRQRPSQARATT